MISDILPDLDKLEYFKFVHGKFSNTKRMEEILVKELGMKPSLGNNDYFTEYEKEWFVFVIKFLIKYQWFLNIN